MILPNKLHHSCLLIVLILNLFACAEKDRTDLFPLEKKIRWQYLSTMEYTRRSV